MTSLDVEFAGLKLRNPIIAASAPPTESIDNIIRCAESGVGAVVTKSSADFDISRFALGGRRTYVDSFGLWAQSTFRHETLTIRDGAKLVGQAVKSVDIPIIASVGSLSLTPKGWLDSCLAMQDAGASMIQLDLFYVPQPRSSPENLNRLTELLDVLTTKLDIPVAPKLNLDFPPHLAARVLKGTKIGSVFVLDSVRVPVPIDVRRGAEPLIKNMYGARECSLFGSWQKPIALQYTSVLYDSLGVPISAGGGLMDGFDAIEAIVLGATSVQYATAIIRHGYRQISKILKQIQGYMEDHNISNLDEIRGIVHKTFRASHEEVFIPVHAVVNRDICVQCGRCTNLVFCEDIHLDSDGMIMINETCDGCGLCLTVCPVPGALSLNHI